MALPPRNPVASLVERQNDNPDLVGVMDDLEIEMPGAVMGRADLADGIDIEQIEDGGVIVDFDPDMARMAGEEDFSANLAEFMDDGELGMLASDLIAQYESARDSRMD